MGTSGGVRISGRAGYRGFCGFLSGGVCGFGLLCWLRFSTRDWDWFFGEIWNSFLGFGVLLIRTLHYIEIKFADKLFILMRIDTRDISANNF